MERRLLLGRGAVHARHAGRPTISTAPAGDELARITIDATDIDRQCLERAQAARYRRRSPHGDAAGAGAAPISSRPAPIAGWSNALRRRVTSDRSI